MTSTVVEATPARGEDGVDALTALVAVLLGGLRELVASDACPGGWAWATSVLGVGVGLLPTLGAVAVAVVRRRIGSRYGPTESVALAGIGLLSAGVFPLLAFTVTGSVFSRAAAGDDVLGLSRRDLRDLADAECLVGPQADYLGQGSVSAAFDPGRPVVFGIALIVLGLLPLVAAMFVAAQARLALRRGPKWPAKFFWLPMLSLVVLSAATPAGTAMHLWLGVTIGAFAGIPVVLLAGVPSREVVRRSLRPNPTPADRFTLRPNPTPADRFTVRPNFTPADRFTVRPNPTLADRLAERFAARHPEPLVTRAASTAPPESAVQADVDGPRPTLLAPAPRPTLHVPSSPDGPPRFRLVRRLGSGGFGPVWLAHDAKLGHAVALKAAHAPDAETEQRIQREAGALGAVQHPHCVRLLDLVDAGSDTGLSELDGMVLVMEYVEGATLGELVRSRGALDDIAAARMWAGIAGALDAAHHRGVLHRDVKPGNIVVDPTGLPHLIDFGIARRTGDATMTLAGFVIGTPDFLAPEVAGGGRATTASDAWQLAATISYAMTGDPPRGGHPDAVSGLRAAASGASLTHLPTRTAHLALLRAALDTEPARRPSLTVVQRALDDWLRRTGSHPDGPVKAGAPAR
ncbi:MAG: serine/threonine-protein kinase [Pseudonocardia sp.]